MQYKRAFKLSCAAHVDAEAFTPASDSGLKRHAVYTCIQAMYGVLCILYTMYDVLCMVYSM